MYKVENQDNTKLARSASLGWTKSAIDGFEDIPTNLTDNI